MRRHAPRLAGLFVFVGMVTGNAFGQAPPREVLELLPQAEYAGIVIRSPSELLQRSKELAKAAGVSTSIMSRDLVDSAAKWLGVEESYSDEQAVALILTRVLGGNYDFEGIVVAVPFRDRDQIAKDVRLSAPPGEIGAIPPGPRLGSDFWLRGVTDATHLYLGGGRNAEYAEAGVKAILSGAKLQDLCSPAARRSLNATDILLHLGVGEWLKADPDQKRYLWTLDESLFEADEIEIARDFKAAVLELRNILVGVTLVDGVSTQYRLQFSAEEDSVSRKLLNDLRGEVAGVGDSAAGQSLPAQAPSLHGLAAAPVIAAGSARLPIARQQLVLRTIFKMVSSQSGSLEAGWFEDWEGGAVTDLRQAVLLGALAEVLPLSRETRFAIYPQPDGAVSTLVVLETEHPEQVLATIRELSDLVTAADTTTGAAPEEVLTEEEIRRLIRQLAADDFLIRSRATTRLLLLGERVRSALTAASQSGDAEVSSRAASLLSKLDASRKAVDEQVLTDNPLVRAHPRLTYQVAAESTAGETVDVIRLELSAEEQPRKQQLEAMFGKEWNRVRIAALPGRVVVGFGTPGEHWAETITNLKENRAGLEDDPRLVRLEDDPERLIEVHFPLSRLVRVDENLRRYRPDAGKVTPSQSLSAVGVSGSATDLGIEFHLPVDEVRVLSSKRGWTW